MNSIEARTLNSLRLIATGRVSWNARSLRIRFEYGAMLEPDHQYLDGLVLSEDYYVREHMATSDRGSVTLTSRGRQLLAELEAEAAR
jgi:hypothetical protein